MARRLGRLAILLGLTSSPAVAAVPAPATLADPCDVTLRSSRSFEAGPVACHYRFRADGGLDVLRLHVTVRDCFDTPVSNCPVTAAVAPAPTGTLALCACEPLAKSGTTSPSGVVYFEWRKIGGRGRAEVRLTAFGGELFGTIPSATFEFTSPDLNGSCQAGSSTTIADLGVFAGGLPPSPYRVESDFDCNGIVNVIDLGLWAGGLGIGCP